MTRSSVTALVEEADPGFLANVKKIVTAFDGHLMTIHHNGKLILKRERK